MSQSMSVENPTATRKLPVPPGPKGHFFWGVLPELRQDMLGLYHDTAPQYGDIVRLRFAGVDTLTLSHPARFSPERSANRPPFAYLPFAAGPRLCIGSQFALTAAQLVPETIAQRYQLRLTPGHPVRPHSSFTLRTSDGLPMTLRRRR